MNRALAWICFLCSRAAAWLSSAFMNKPCPLCGKQSVKVIYYGLPHRLCCDEACSCMFGFWFELTRYLPFNGFLMIYEGPYLPALWHWLTGCGED